jgi:hypothetical protein
MGGDIGMSNGFKNVKVLGITGTHLIKREREMFCWGRVVAVHKVGDHEIIEYLDRKMDGCTITYELTDKHMFHVNNVGQSCNTLDEALLTAIAVKYDGVNTQAHSFMSRAIGIENWHDRYLRERQTMTVKNLGIQVNELKADPAEDGLNA